MTRWLRQNGYRTRRAGMRANVGCSEAGLARLETRLEAYADATGERVAIIGQSRGGVFARALAVRRPDLVSGIVTLGAPTVRQLSAHPVVLAHIFIVGALGTGRVPGMFSVRCLRGSCCERFRGDMTAALPSGVGYTALYSRTDGVVDWRACLDPAAEQIEVRASHLGMGLNAEVYAEVGHALGTFARAEAGQEWAQAA
jgi:pimeloyl-ACP methyl ester carboxylesterase